MPEAVLYNVYRDYITMLIIGVLNFEISVRTSAIWITSWLSCPASQLEDKIQDTNSTVIIYAFMHCILSNNEVVQLMLATLDPVGMNLRSRRRPVRRRYGLRVS